MINGAHFLLYSKDPEADRAFLRDVLELRSVDAGRGWLIFALPPAEIAVHPSDEDSARNADDGVAGAGLYLMCDDLKSTMISLKAKKASFAPVQDARWGIVTAFALPSGAKIGLYQPKHPTATQLR
jgi:catechol 2,3-dioxygenase-like lactoylglutathione lyase family enzyme